MLTALVALLTVSAAASPLKGRQSGAQRIFPSEYLVNANWTRCVGVASPTAGTPLTIQDVTSAYNKWHITHDCRFAPTALKLDGTNLCAFTGEFTRGGFFRGSGQTIYLKECTWSGATCDLGGQGDGGAWLYSNDIWGTKIRSAFCLDNDGGRNNVGNKVHLWECHGNDQAQGDGRNQMWYVQDV